MRIKDVRSVLLTLSAYAVAFAIAAPGVSAAAPYTLNLKVTAITDGDTIVGIDSKNVQHKIRLAEIDAPEKAQPFGKDSKAALSKMVYGKDVVVNVSTKDRYGRELGNVLVKGVDVNGSLVRYGWAHVYVQYRHRPILLDYELEAREARRGLWADEKTIILPWLWRKGSRP